MIRVIKSNHVPVQLTDKGIPATKEDCRLYDANPGGYQSGTSKFNFDEAIYGHKSVKEQLIAEQYGKCCFCEADFTANGYGDVEHFRPKGGYTVNRTSKLIRPGYYWLAYDWTNLFLSCEICNQRHKKNFFPLADESSRAKSHADDYRTESNLLLHPSFENPEDHISFNRHVPAAKNKRGKLSITAFGIDRPKLNSNREKHLQNVRNNLFLAGFEPAQLSESERLLLVKQSGQDWSVIEELIQIAKLFIAKATSHNQPFAAMVRANFPDLIHKP